MDESKMKQLYLSRRNLLTLLSKLDRLEVGEETACSIIKYANPTDPYCNSIDSVMVTAIPDELFYTNRAPGEMHPKEELSIFKGTH
jgi:hypothetical protein